MSLSTSSSDQHRHQPNIGLLPVPWSPTSATQELSHPGSFPASESKSPLDTPSVPPLMLPGKAFEVRKFNVDTDLLVHAKPVLLSRHSLLPPMPRLFERIAKNDRDFVQQLPASRQAQEQLGFFLDRTDLQTRCTPLTAALVHGHLNLAVDLLMLGAGPMNVDDEGRTPREVAGEEGMSSMVLRFMTYHHQQGSLSSKPSITAKEWQKLFNKIDAKTGHTLLTWAISQRHDKLVALLLDAGADSRGANRCGRTALEEACGSGSIAIVDSLLENCRDRGLELRHPLFIAAIDSAVHANRPMVLARLLSFFRRQSRSPQREMAESENEHSFPVAASPAWIQRDAYSLFLGGRRVASATFDVMMDRTSDTFLLTEHESGSLRLNEVLAFAQKKGLAKMAEIIHAHAKLPKGD